MSRILNNLIPEKLNNKKKIAELFAMQAMLATSASPRIVTSRGPPKSWNRGRGRGLLNRGKWPWTVLNRGKSPRFFSVHDGCFHDLGCLLKSGNN